MNRRQHRSSSDHDITDHERRKKPPPPTKQKKHRSISDDDTTVDESLRNPPYTKQSSNDHDDRSSHASEKKKSQRSQYLINKHRSTSDDDTTVDESLRTPSPCTIQQPSDDDTTSHLSRKKPIPPPSLDEESHNEKEHIPKLFPRRSAPQAPRRHQGTTEPIVKIKKYSGRSSSENDVTPDNPSTPVPHAEPVSGKQIDETFLHEIRELFGIQLSSRLSRLLADLNVWNKDCIVSSESHKILLGAASIGFRPVDLGKLNKWLQEITSNQHDSSARPAVRTKPVIRKGSLDSVLASESGISGAGSLLSPYRSQTIVQHVQKRFRSEFCGVILGILEDCMVECEEDLAYIGESVMDAAMSSGQLTLIQINRLSDWIESVKGRRRGLKDPNPDRGSQKMLSLKLVDALSTIVNAETDTETRNVAKRHTAIAMLEISEKKWHFKGLRDINGSQEFIGTRF